VTATREQFLAHWTQLLSLERGAVTLGRDDIWNLPAAERMRKGGCVAGLVLCAASYVQPEGVVMADTEHLQRRMLYTFRAEGGGSGLAAMSKLLSKGAHLLLSTDCGLVAVARVVVHELSADRLVLVTRRQLKLPPGELPP
jgi:hypothetical protein